MGKFNLKKISWLQNNCKMAENTDESINDSSHRMLKEMQLLMGGRYPPDINCDANENLPYLFENRCLIALEGGETPIAYCSV